MTSAPTMAHIADPQAEATARAAAKAGMTVADWVAFTDHLEAIHTNRRITERELQSIPRYTDGATA